MSHFTHYRPDVMLGSSNQNGRAASHGRTREPILEYFLARYRYRFSLNFIRELLAHGIKVRGFDIGCGYHGSFVERANRLPGVSFYGGDLLVVDNNPHLVAFDLASPSHLPMTPNLVTMHALLEHVDDPLTIVQYVHDILEPGGYLLITVPSKIARPLLEFLAFQLRLVSQQEIADHKHYYDRSSIMTLLQKPNGPYAFVRHRYFQFGFNNSVLAQKAV